MTKAATEAALGVLRVHRELTTLETDADAKSAAVRLANKAVDAKRADLDAAVAQLYLQVSPD